MLATLGCAYEALRMLILYLALIIEIEIRVERFAPFHSLNILLAYP